MNARYFDAHCHVQFDVYAADQEQVLKTMEERAIAGLVVGVDASSSARARALAKRHQHLVASAGLHPNSVLKERFEAGFFEEFLKDPRVVAVGECGLDYYRPQEVTPELKKKQKEVFLAHIELSAGHQKPLMIHARPSRGTTDAYRDLIEMLTTAKQEHGETLSGNIHFFVGGIDEARSFFELGFTVSYTAVITFARDYDEVIRFAPLGSLLAETDSPYVAPSSRRGARNDPSAVTEVVDAIAGIRGEEQEIVRTALLKNTLGLFRPPGIEAV